MNDFNYYSPTRVVFGRSSVEKTGEAVAREGGKRALIVYGGGHAVKSGLIKRVEDSLESAGVAFVEFGGARPNPLLSHAEKGVELAIEKGCDFILAVGGGSVIDTAKGIAHGAANQGTALWDIWKNPGSLKKSLPIGAVLTIAAAGSELSDSAVLTNEETSQKQGMNTDFNRCRFAIMNPELLMSLPPYQLAAGITDIMMHTMERYFIPGIQCALTDEIAEGLLRTVIENGRKVIENPNDYDAMAEVMWSSSLSHNNLTECGRGKDFSVHKLGMALSALYDDTHGATLSAVWGAWARYQYKEAIGRFARFARKVFGVEEKDDERAALEGIERAEEFWKSIGMPVDLNELCADRGLPDEKALIRLAELATRERTMTLSRLRPLNVEECVEIYKMAIRP
ncbi:MAG: iron-containing alcohol dehydrogenase [Lachnospiraceae bacterium]|nr:iron-containing alcohol dehydrogenase [Lachnospiraceae bacterium]